MASNVEQAGYNYMGSYYQAPPTVAPFMGAYPTATPTTTTTVSPTGTMTNVPTAAPYTPDPEFVETDPRKIAAKYAMSWAIINADPGLRNWFNDFARRYVEAKGKIDYSVFKLELESQSWWRAHSATYINALRLEVDNPADWSQALDQTSSALRATAMAMGALVDEPTLREIAANSIRFGWTPQQQQAALGSYLTANPRSSYLDYEGAAGQSQDELQSWASNNGVSLSQDMVKSFVKSLVMGTTTLDEIKSDIRKTYMAGAYPAWADKIQAGMDIADLAAPYKATMARVLEMNENEIGLEDVTLRSSLQSVGADGKPRVMPLYEYEQSLRKDPRWQKTDNAYSTYSNVAQDLLRTFGFA